MLPALPEEHAKERKRQQAAADLAAFTLRMRDLKRQARAERREADRLNSLQARHISFASLLPVLAFDLFACACAQPRCTQSAYTHLIFTGSMMPGAD